MEVSRFGAPETPLPSAQAKLKSFGNGEWWWRGGAVRCGAAFVFVSGDSLPRYFSATGVPTCRFAGRTADSVSVAVWAADDLSTVIQNLPREFEIVQHPESATAKVRCKKTGHEMPATPGNVRKHAQCQKYKDDSFAFSKFEPDARHTSAIRTSQPTGVEMDRKATR